MEIPNDSKSIATTVLRISFGLALTLIGVAHYSDPAGYAAYVSQGFPFAWLGSIAMIWGYILPGLMILGGLSMAFSISLSVGSYAAGIALGSIPVGLMLKSVLGTPMDETMPYTLNAFIWLTIYALALRPGSCTAGATEKKMTKRAKRK